MLKKIWLELYSPEECRYVKYEQSEVLKLGNPTIDIVTDVIDFDIPLLISKVAMKKANTINKL